MNVVTETIKWRNREKNYMLEPKCKNEFVEILEPLEEFTSGGRRYYLFLCKRCNTIFEALPNDIMCRNTTSCGCYNSDSAKKRTGNKNGKYKHGLSRHHLNNIWAGMNQRCINPNNPGYHHYGGRGIKVCE